MTSNIGSLEQTLLENVPWNKARIKFVARFLRGFTLPELAAFVFKLLGIACQFSFACSMRCLELDMNVARPPERRLLTEQHQSGERSQQEQREVSDFDHLQKGSFLFSSEQGLECLPKETTPMSLIVEAIYESGVLKPLAPLPELKERERVRLTLERNSVAEEAVLLIEQQRQHRIQIEPRFAREIGDSHEYDLLGG